MLRVRPGWLVALFRGDPGGQRVAALADHRAPTAAAAPTRSAGPSEIWCCRPGSAPVSSSCSWRRRLIVAGAMAGRGLSARLASAAALAISLLLVALTVWYYHINVHPPVSAGYGLYIGAAVAIAAVLCSVWALVASLSSSGRTS